MMRFVEIKCFCRRQPLLAVGGRDENGNPFIHVKSWKGGRLYTEVVVTSGEIFIHCRECLRWQRIRIVTGELDHSHRKVQLPPSIEEALSARSGGSLAQPDRTR